MSIDKKMRRQHIGLAVACVVGMAFSGMASSAESDHAHYAPLTVGANVMRSNGPSLQADAFRMPVLDTARVAGMASGEAAQPMKTALFDLSCGHPWYRMGILELVVCQPW